MSNNLDFLDIDTGLSDDTLSNYEKNRKEELKNKPKENPNNNSTVKNTNVTQVKRGNIKRSINFDLSEKNGKSWAFIGIASLILSISFILEIFGISVFRTPGIKAAMETNLGEVTISQVLNTTFKVKNSTTVRANNGIDWYLNNKLVFSGSNQCQLGLNDITWGVSELKAKYKESEVNFYFVLNKGYSEVDALHTQLSMLTEFDNSAIGNVNEYTDEFNEGYLTYLLDSDVCQQWGGGTFRTTQKNKSFTLETYEDTMFNVSINEVLYLSTEESPVIDIRGNWDEVYDCILHFTPTDWAVSYYIPVRYLDDQILPLMSHEYDTVNNTYVISVNTNERLGFILSRYVDDKVEAVQPQFVTVTLDLNDNSKLAIQDKVDKSQWEKTNEDGEKYYDIPEVQKNPVLERFVDEVKSSAQEVTKHNLEFRDFKYKDDVFQDDKGKTNVGSLAELIVDYIGNGSITSRYNNIIFIADLSKLSHDRLEYFINYMYQAADYLDKYEVSLIAIGAKEDNLESLLEETIKSLHIYEIKDVKDTVRNVDMLSKINSKISESDEAVIDYEEGREVYVIAHNDFDYDTDAIKSRCTFNSRLQFGNWYGQCLLTKLGYQKQFNKDMVAGGTIAYDSSSQMFTELELDGYEATSMFIDDSEASKVNNSDINSANIEDMVNVLSFNVLNNINGNFISPHCNEGELVGTDLLKEISNNINDEKPVIAMIKSLYGYESVLITSIYQDKNNSSMYYFGIYDPMNPERIRYAEFSVTKAFSYSKGLGVGYKFNYIGYNGLQFTDIKIVDKVEVFDNGILYEESVYDT